MEPEAWVGQCEGCGLYCVLYEEVEFVCGKCHGTINPGNPIAERLDKALTVLFESQLPTSEVLAAIWARRYVDTLQSMPPNERQALLTNQWAEEEIK